MRVGVFGDVHGNFVALDAVLRALAAADVDALLCTGDLVNYGPEPVAALRCVLHVATVCVAGNHDRLLAVWRGETLPGRPGRDMGQEDACLRWTAARLAEKDRRALAVLPDTMLWPPENPCLVVAHGSPESVDEYVDADLSERRWRQLTIICRSLGVSVAVLGHTHRAMDESRGGVRFCNPGSTGWPKDGDPRAAYGILDVDPQGRRRVRFEVHRAAYDAALVTEAMLRGGLPAAIAQAISEGRPAAGGAQAGGE